MELKQEIEQVLDAAVEALREAGDIAPGGRIVLGCSTSEVAGARIGKGSVPELGEVIAQAMLNACRKRGLNAAFQCCEHLNRSSVMEQRVRDERRLTQLKAIPQPKAGGSVPAAAWKLLDKPALAMAVQAEAGIDIGDTLVGMHIKPGAVPLRIEYGSVGHANLGMAYSRLPYVGGSRAGYQ